MRTGKGSTSSNLGKTNPRVALKVGYGRPPIQHRGRPKGKKSEATILYELLNRKITVREGGKPRRITVLEAILLRFTEDALKGNTKTAAFLFNRYASRDADVNDDSSLTEDDRHVLSSFVRRLEAKLGAKT